MRKLTWVLAALAVLLLAGGAVLRWVVVPSQLKLPGDTDTSREYRGTLQQMLDAQAVASGNVGQAFLKDVPVTMTRSVVVEETQGDSALVRETRVMKQTATGRTLASATHRYAVDRKSLDGASGMTDVPAGTIVPKGITISFPFDTQKQDYVGYVTDTGTSTTERYVGTADRKGLTTYRFTADVKPTKIVDPEVLKALPAQIPKAQLVALAPLLGIPAAQQAQLATLLAGLPDPVPLTYTYAVRSAYWVDPMTGMIVDMTRTESRNAAVTVPGTTTIVPLAPVYAASYAMSPSAVTAAVDDADSAHTLVLVLGTVVPLVMGVTAVGLLVAAWVTRRRPPTAPEVPLREREPVA